MTLSDLSDDEREEIEQAVDRVFLKVTGRTYREDERLPAAKDEPDSLEKIAADFPSLFGKP